MKSGLKVKRRRKKRVKSREKKLQFFFCLRTFTWKDEMPLIKVAYLMLNFLNLKSFLSNLFFAVASSLSTLWNGNLPDFIEKNRTLCHTCLACVSSNVCFWNGILFFLPSAAVYGLFLGAHLEIIVKSEFITWGVTR